MTAAQIKAISATSTSDRYGWASDTGCLYFIPAGSTGAAAKVVFSPWIFKSTSFTAEAGCRYQVSCASTSVEVTLPDGLAEGDALQLEDADLTWGTRPLSVLPAASGLGTLINGSSSPYADSVVGDKLSVAAINQSVGVSIK